MASVVTVEPRGTDGEHRVLRRTLLAWRYGPYAAPVEAIEREAERLAVATEAAPRSRRTSPASTSPVSARPPLHAAAAAHTSATSTALYRAREGGRRRVVRGG